MARYQHTVIHVRCNKHINVYQYLGLRPFKQKTEIHCTYNVRNSWSGFGNPIGPTCFYRS